MAEPGRPESSDLISMAIQCGHSIADGYLFRNSAAIEHSRSRTSYTIFEIFSVFG